MCSVWRVALNFELSFDLNAIFLGFDIQKLVSCPVTFGGGGLRFALGRYPVGCTFFDIRSFPAMYSDHHT